MLNHGKTVADIKASVEARDLQHRELMLAAMKLEQEANDSAMNRLIDMAKVGIETQDRMAVRRINEDRNAMDWYKTLVETDTNKAELAYKIQELEYLRKNRSDAIGGRMGYYSSATQPATSSGTGWNMIFNPGGSSSSGSSWSLNTSAPSTSGLSSSDWGGGSGSFNLGGFY
jgi:hypothetical protein